MLALKFVVKVGNVFLGRSTGAGEGLLGGWGGGEGYFGGGGGEVGVGWERGDVTPSCSLRDLDRSRGNVK